MAERIKNKLKKPQQSFICVIKAAQSGLMSKQALAMDLWTQIYSQQKKVLAQILRYFSISVSSQ